MVQECNNKYKQGSSDNKQNIKACLKIKRIFFKLLPKHSKF